MLLIHIYIYWIHRIDYLIYRLLSCTTHWIIKNSSFLYVTQKTHIWKYKKRNIFCYQQKNKSILISCWCVSLQMAYGISSICIVLPLLYIRFSIILLRFVTRNIYNCYLKKKNLLLFSKKGKNNSEIENVRLFAAYIIYESFNKSSAFFLLITFFISNIYSVWLRLNCLNSFTYQIPRVNNSQLN